MARYTTIEDEETLIAFVRKASEYFTENPDHWTYGGDPTPGEYLALRWGLGSDCVKVIKVDEYFQPIIYGQSIKKKEV